MMDNSSNHDTLHLLHRNPMGYIARCRCCSEVQVSIGNIIAHLDLQNFLSFFRTLKAVSRDLESNSIDSPDGQKILLRTPVKSILMSFTIHEFAETLELFSQAWVLMEAASVVKQGR